MGDHFARRAAVDATDVTFVLRPRAAFSDPFDRDRRSSHRPVVLNEERERLLAWYQHYAELAREKEGPEAEARALDRWRAEVDARSDTSIEAADLFPLLSLETLREVWRATPPERWKLTVPACRWLVALLSDDALEVLHVLTRQGRVSSQGLVDVVAPWVAPAMAYLLASHGRVWLLRHEEVAYAGLIHAALTGDERSPQQAIRWMARRDGGVAARRVARETWGAEIEEIVGDILRPDRDAPPPLAKRSALSSASFAPRVRRPSTRIERRRAARELPRRPVRAARDQA